MNLLWLQAFRAVMKTGSASGAEEIMLRTQPQISRMIGQLEKELEMKLFERVGRRLVPTEQAVEFLKGIEPPLQGIDAIPAIAEDIRNKRARGLTMAVEPFLAQALLPTALETIIKGSGTRIAVDLCLRSVGFWSTNKSADVGVVALPFAQTDLKSLPFVEARVVAVVPKDHELAQKSLIALRDFRKEQLISFRSSTLLRSQIDSAAATSGVALLPQIEVSTGPLACELVARGLGVCIADPILALSTDRDCVTVRPLAERIDLTYGFLVSDTKLKDLHLRTTLSAIANTAVQIGGAYVDIHPIWERLIKEE